MGGIAREALHFVEHAQEDLQDGVAVVLGVGLGVDVEQDHISLPSHGAAHVAQQHGVAELALEEVERSSGLTGAGLCCFHIGEQVRQDFDEVRLAGAEEARHPHAHARDDGGVVGVLRGGQVGVEELAQVLGDLLGGHVFVQLLPDAFGIALVGFDDAVDGPVDGLGEQFLNLHGYRSVSWGLGEQVAQDTRRKAR